MKRYLFNITIIGDGENPDEAWIDATESFSLDPGITEYDYTELCSECNFEIYECECKN